MAGPDPNPSIERVRHALHAKGVSLDPPNPLRSGIYSRGYLPHVKREGAWYFVTFRLVDSLPTKVLLDFKRQQAERLRAPWLGCGITTTGHFHRQHYLLDEWVIMPNHVHLILWPMPNFTLSEILRSRKRYTAREANRILGRTGEAFWQHESYDHWIRSEEEKMRIRRYIRNNPVKTRLCSDPETWRWGSAYLTPGRLPTGGTAD